MKKKIIVPLLALVLALGLMLSACGTNAGATVTYGEVGTDDHCYFPYATVTVDSKGKATAVEMGEAFGPSGKLTIKDGVPSYSSNAWYPGIAKISAAVQAEETMAAKQALISNKYFISIDGKIFVLDVASRTAGGQTADALIFVGKEDGLKLSDSYLAENIKWYVDAIKESKVFICSENGTRLSEDSDITLPDESTVKAKFADGALLKNDENSTYRPTFGLSGTFFKQAMKEHADFAKNNNFDIEYETVAKGGNHQGLRVKGLTLTVYDEETHGVTRPTSQDSATYLNYSASYMKVAEKAYELATEKLSDK